MNPGVASGGNPAASGIKFEPGPIVVPNWKARE